MNKYKKPEIDPVMFQNNPLTNADFKIPIRKRIDTKIYTDSEGIKVPNEYEVEAESISRIYKKAENRKFVSRLNPGTKSLFLWVMYELDYGKDYLWLNRARYLEENDVKSVNTYKAALADLVRYMVLYPVAGTKEKYYWINPRLFFCGSRVKKYPKNVVVVSENYLHSTVELVKMKAV